MATLPTLHCVSPADAEDANRHAFGAAADETVLFDFDDTPANFLSFDTLTVNVVYRTVGTWSDDTTWHLNVMMRDSAGNALSGNEKKFVDSDGAGGTRPTTDTLVSNTLTSTPTNNKTTIDGARISLHQFYQRNMGGDGCFYEINHVYLTGTYTASATATLDQSVFRARSDDGSETAATWKDVENANWSQALDENFRVRFVLQETGGAAASSVTPKLQYNVGGAGWNDVSGATTNVRGVASSQGISNNSATTDQIGGTGTFVAGEFSDDGVATFRAPNIGANGHSEFEFCLTLRSADLSGGESIQLRLVRSTDSTPYTAYTNTPTITVGAAVNDGTLSETLDAATVSASGTVVNPIDGSLSETLDAATSSASGTQTVSGSVSETLADATSTASGTQTLSGSVSETLGAATLAATGAITFTGTLSETLGDTTSSASGSQTIEGSVSETLESVSSAASGTQEIQGTASETLESATLAASGTTVLTITGSLSETLDDTASSASGTQTISGSVSETLDPTTASSSGTQTVSGSVSETLDPATLAASSETTVTGTVSETLESASLQASGQQELAGSLSKALDPSTLSGVGTVTPPGVSGALTASLEDVSVSAQGTQTVGGSASEALADATLSASGTVAAPGEAVLSETLDDTTSSGSGTQTLGGSASELLDDTGLTAAGTQLLDSVLSEILEDASASASGTVSDAPPGTLSETLQSTTLNAQGTQSISGSVSETLGDVGVTASGTAANPVSGSLNITLPDVVGEITSTPHIIGTLNQRLGDANVNALATWAEAVYSILFPDELIGYSRRLTRAGSGYRRFITAGNVRQLSIWRDSQGDWHSGHPTPAQVDDAVVMYQGGRAYELDEDEATVLETAGFQTTLSG